MTDTLDTPADILAAMALGPVQELQDTIRFAWLMAGDLPPEQREAFRNGLRIKEAARAVLPPAEPDTKAIRETLADVYSMKKRLA